MVPALASLAMGDRNAVDFMQAGHCELLKRAGALDAACEVHYGEPLPRSKTLLGVMIDDRLSLTIDCGGAAGQARRARADREWDAVMTAYGDSCGTPVPEKTCRHARVGRVWGARLDGRRGIIGGPAERRALLAVLSLRLALSGWGTANLARRISSTWGFHLMFKREAFAFFRAFTNFRRFRPMTTTPQFCESYR